MIKIILDTNFLVYCAEQKIDYAEEIRNLMNRDYELSTTSQVIAELKKLKEKTEKYSDKKAADLALKILKANNVKEIKTKGKNADESIISLSKGNIVATLDLELSKKAEKGIVIKAKKKLAFR